MSFFLSRKKKDDDPLFILDPWNQSGLLEVGKWVFTFNLYSFFGGVILKVKSHELEFISMMLLCDLSFFFFW